MKPKSDAVYFRDPDLPGIDVCRMNKSYHHFPEHFHDDIYLIGMIFSGHCYCLGKRKQASASGPGTVTLLNPGQIHSGVPADETPLDYAIFHISLNAMSRLACELNVNQGRMPEFTRAILKEPVLSALMKNLFETMISSRDSLEKEALMISACHFIFSRYGLTGKNQNNATARHQPVLKAREILSSRLDRKLPLAEVAGSVGLSQYHFLRTFKQETGISPHLFRTLRRIESAKALLKKNIPPAQIALETGFTDQSHFSNTFRRYVGATPGQYFTQN